MPVAFPYTGFPDGQAYPQIPTGTTTVNVNSTATLNTALSNAVAGHRIVLANGTYSGAFAVTGKNGSASAGIMIEAATTGGAVFASGATWNINNSSYVTLKGLAFPYDLSSGNLTQFRGNAHHCRITRCLFGPTSIGTPGANKSPFVYMGDDTDFIRIDHNEIRNKSNPGNAILGDGNFTTFQCVKHIRIDHNYIHDIRPEVDNEKEPIRLGVSTMSKTFSNSVIERNVFANCIAEPEIVSAKACGIRISGNVFSKSIGGPVYRHGTNGVMNDNYVVDDGVSEPPPDPDPDPGPGTRTPGVGGIPRPAPGPNVVLATGNTGDLLINVSGTPTQYRIYDGGGFTCGQLSVRANYVIVQNYRVNADADLGISIRCHHAVVQHCDVKNVHAPGDLNAMEVFGDDNTIAYNTCIDFITGDAGGSHTDGIQTWNQRGNESTSRLIVQGNVFTGAPSEGPNTHIHQAVIGEGKDSTDGGGGGEGESNDWFIADNYWTADCKFDDINNVTYTRNTMAGNDKRAVVVTSMSSGMKYYSDNKVTGQLSVGIGATVIPGPGPLTAPWLGGGGTPTPSATLVHRVVGIPSTTSVPVAVRVSNASSVRLQVSTSATFASGVISGPTVAPNAQGDAQLTVSGLTAGTTYYHRCGVTSGGVEGFTPISSKPFRTAPVGQTSFAFCFASCDETSNATTPATIAARNDDFFLHVGDLYYNDSASSSVSQFRTEMVNKIQASNYKALFDTTPMSYTPSDHDGMSDNGNISTDSAGWTNWNSVYRELFPSLSFPGSLGVYKTWTWGRVRFLQLDTRSFASNFSASDNSSKTMLGATQKQWLKDQITNDATSKVFVLVQDTVWMGGPSSGEVTWRGFTTERTELGNFFIASGKNFCILGGDMHALAANDGGSSPGGVTVFQAAPLSNDVSHETGPWTVGPTPGTGSKAQQYGRIVVTDTGAQISLAFTGYSNSNAQRLTLTKTYNV